MTTVDMKINDNGSEHRFGMDSECHNIRACAELRDSIQMWNRFDNCFDTSIDRIKFTLTNMAEFDNVTITADANTIDVTACREKDKDPIHYHATGHDCIIKAINILPVILANPSWDHVWDQTIGEKKDPANSFYIDAYLDINEERRFTCNELYAIRYDYTVNNIEITRVDLESGVMKTMDNIYEFITLIESGKIRQVPMGGNALVLRQLTALKELHDINVKHTLLGGCKDCYSDTSVCNRIDDLISKYTYDDGHTIYRYTLAKTYLANAMDECRNMLKLICCGITSELAESE